ncbi:cytidylyltransferase domain-containing protein [Methanococcoides burtonii]|uniref:N-acylneuraminate cytidylyltransferase protein n=1 Tax=Methanococcoides burtonii (strain DSM 6242 / NBRC 107633 / OCM 468 / ACE-M) TaxID=259564 RepID=Q12VN7_METBU|nr:acylneuraminate cytidylyltransferase family protein [Methanococcoides burtonii]ABE52489.1 N-acylneuraminate cytidylyltransferase protein [Methanococcoides burtonii DSM 6242]
MDKNNIFAIIPARSGSKGIAGKNIRSLNGKPLICHTIEEAVKSRYLERVFISTDDPLIAKISKQCGAKIINRPAELAEDESPTINAIFHAIDTIKNAYDTEIIILLQPTSPLRNAADIDKALDMFMKTDCDSVISMCKVEHSPYWSFKYEGDKFKSLFGNECLQMRRQELPEVYRPNGAIYITTIENLYKNNGFYCDKIIPYIMPAERSVDIDDEIDFKLAELLIQEYTKNAKNGSNK